MARVRSVDFLPQIFQTDTNRQFLAATLDTLTQEPQFKKTQGYIGRRVGPGVDPNDVYVIEPDKTRTDYQLEAGIVSLVPDTNEIKDLMTYPGLADAISYQGGDGSRSDRLYESDYYCWDPFVDFDTLVNFNQYYWVPNGPDVVDVSATPIPATEQFTVNRANGVYTVPGQSGPNPTITLVRGGSYTFSVAQNRVETINFRVQNQGVSAYLIDRQPNPALTLIRGNTYVFQLNLRDNFPFWIKTLPTLGEADAYDQGVLRNGAVTGSITFTVPQDAPDQLYYTSQNNISLQGTINVVNGQSGTGSGFWIQTAPGVSGTLPAYPNISSRDVLGVQNNGIDLGQVVFNVPRVTAQQFYYNLPNFTVGVDLLTDLKFDEINNQPLLEFIARTGGIDGITNLIGRTLVFSTPIISPEAGGWFRETLYDPLDPTQANNDLAGSYDSLPYDLTTVIPAEDRRQLWQISTITSNGIAYIQLEKISNIPDLHKFPIRFGTVYSNTVWYKTQTQDLERVPLLSAASDTLYYQDGTDPEIYGVIKLVDGNINQVLFIDQIEGQSQYTSPNGVVFTNGLKVKFTGDVVPANYASGTVTVVCTSTQADINAITTYSTDILYPNQQIVFTSPTVGGLQPGITYYVGTIINELQFTVTLVPNGADVVLQDGSIAQMIGTAINDRQYYVSGVGSSIRLLPVTDFVTPEEYVETEDPDGSTVTTQPNLPDYITIDRASIDLNAWSRSNRWFHKDVLVATATYNDTEISLPNEYRGRRPILQFRPGIRLWNMGTRGKQPVNIIDFQETDAFSDIEGSLSYSTDGYALENGSRVIFAADIDPEVRNKIYQVEFITPDSIPDLIAQPIIHLRLADDGLVLADDSTVCLNGDTLKGVTFWYDGDRWIRSQQKTSIQQAPLYNVYDLQGRSFGDSTVYPSTNFAGSKLFSYALTSSSQVDPVLQLPLQYRNIANIGDIVFDNNLYSDSFIYTLNRVSQTVPISTGTVREYSSRTQYRRQLGWQTAATTSKVYQQFRFTYNGQDLVLDVRAQDVVTVPSIKIYVENVFVDPSQYNYTRTNNSTTITFADGVATGSLVEVLVLSAQTSNVAFRQVPLNLENNPFNANSDSFTLGTVRQHYDNLCENLTNLQGEINGANNTRDLGNIVPFGLTILQQSSPLTLAGYFLRDPGYDFFQALIYNSREYTKYKNLILDNVTQQELQFQTAAEILDTAIENLTQGRVSNQPFYWSDMLPSGAVYTETVYTVTNITTNTFDTTQVYDYDTANYLGLNVYFQDTILIRGLDYTVSTDAPQITVLFPLAVGDQIVLREYATTYGSFCPNTPTKLGLYPAWRPDIITVQGSFGPTQVIRGHDGSQTPLFNDLRDDVLLEFERRIYNNLKLDNNPVPLTITDVLPGQFRETGYSFSEINTLLNQDFLSYLAWNKLDYRTQDYRADNEFTWNYSTAKSKLDNRNLLGAWRGINRYYYDTEQPESTPWEMLGFTVEPDWWQDNYGAAPYTQNNLVLWDDLAAGVVRDPAGVYIRPQYARPGLQQVIPTGDQGQLLSPFDSVVGTYDSTQFRRSWSLGDGSPVESSWYNSSSYPFAVMRVLALTRPAKFFALFADRDLYKYDNEFGQYLLNQRYRLDANGVQVYGDGVSKASYINWIVDYNRQTGINSTDILETDLANLDVRLCYRMASFSDKKLIQVYTDRATPAGTNNTLLLPDQSYNLLLYKNQPFSRASYSSVIIQNVPGGYAVFGYSTTQPFFNVQTSVTNGQLDTIGVGSVRVRVPTLYLNKVTQVPYGFIFRDRTSVVDFLLSYGEFLTRQGLTFDSIENGYVLDWRQMAVEFLYWSQQGWAENTVISINPLALRMSVTRPGAVVDSINVQTIESLLLDQNRRQFPTRNLDIVRLENTFTVRPLTDQVLSYIDLKYTSFEHVIVLNNASEFGDLIYDPITGARQSRLNLVAVTTSGWNGSIDTPGFILNTPTVQDWDRTRIYAKGEIVRYKGAFWSAATIVQPSERFNYNDWLQSDYAEIERGLLPNIANKADQLINSYNINSANLESDNDLLSYGLIGFRPRQYMSALNLDDVSQVNIYRQFLGTKGTIRSAELMSNARLRKESAQYDIYENWAVQQGVYGANANRSFFEIRLNRALLDSNPSTIQVTEPQQTSTADQSVLVSDLWRESYYITSSDILPVTTETVTDTALPSAGYVNLNDIDITVFDLDDPSTLAADLDRIEDGTSIWVAKVNDYDWNVYASQAVPGVIQHVCDNLDGTSIVIFSKQHGLTVNDTIIIKQFDSEIDGVYRVISVPTLTKITIEFSFTGDRTVVNGTGFAFELVTQRVSQFSDAVDLAYANLPVPGARVWIDNDGTGHWAVVEKRQVFLDPLELAPRDLDATQAYGTSVAQATNGLASFVGSSRLGFNTGATIGGVYVYVRGASEIYQPTSPIQNADAIMQLMVTGVRELGYSLAMGDKDWGASGAPGSLGPSSEANVGYVGAFYRDLETYRPGTNPYVMWQLLTKPGNLTTAGSRFGNSIDISRDERWMYVGSPGENKVYAYARVPVPVQRIQAQGDSSESYDVASVIQVESGDQLTVTLDGQELVFGTQFTVTTYSVPGVGTRVESVEFAVAPGSDQQVVIQRRTQHQIDGGTYRTVPASGGSGTGAEFIVYRARRDVTVVAESGGIGYQVGDSLTIDAADFDGGTSPANDITMTVTSVTAAGQVVAVGSVTYTAPAVVNTFDIGQYLFTVSSIYSFSVLVDDVLQRPNIDYTFDSNTQEVTFVNNPADGSVIIARAQSYWQLVDTLTVAGLDSAAEFGASVTCTTDGRQVMVGTPQREVNGVLRAGTVYVFDRDVQRFVYGQDPSSISFTVLGTVTAPVSVLVNNTFLQDQAMGVIDGVNTFVVSGNTVTLNTDLVVGDFLDIETNQFALLQVINQDTPETFANFGQAVDICSNNCSLYVGAPQSSLQIYKGGVVERLVNQARIYGTITSTVSGPTLTAGNTLRVNNQDITVPAATAQVSSLQGLANAINNEVPNVTATVSSGRLTVSVSNQSAGVPGNLVQVLPGSVGTAFDDLGFDVYASTQTMLSPYAREFAGFGSAISVSDNATQIVVGAPNGNMYIVQIFDEDPALFDAGVTDFYSEIANSGAVYVYDYAESANGSITNPAKFIVTQQIEIPDVATQDQLGSAVSYVQGLLYMAAPGSDKDSEGVDDSQANYGRVYVVDNPGAQSSWRVLQAQRPVVDIRLLNSVFLYNLVSSSTTEFLDFFDPLQGKILGAARQNIDYIGAVDPAGYNSGGVNLRGTTWTGDHQGEIWWDTSTVRFIDPNQDSLTYAARRWGQVFPGSSIDVYEWITSTVPPDQYPGPGVVRDIGSYSVRAVLQRDGTIVTEYFYWVRSSTAVATRRGKTLSTEAISRYIENPRGSGIAYLAAINASTVAIYNCEQLIEAQDTVLHIEFDQQFTTDNVHVEYQLVPENRADGWITPVIYRKLQDSLCGVDEVGNNVPDIFLSPPERYGIQFRPRQSMFVDRYSALENFVQRVNSVLVQFPISETRRFVLLDSADPEPSAQSGLWNKRVDNIEQLSFQDIYAVPLGYSYLVNSDSTQQGLWTIYTVISGQLLGQRQLRLARVQNYRTSDYWDYINWVRPGYNDSVRPKIEVQNYADLDTLVVPVGTSVKVLANSQGKFEIWLLEDTGWERVVLQDGTIALDDVLYDYSLGRFGFDAEVFDAQYFDQAPTTETRKIIQAVNQELFIDDLLIERNRLLVLMFEYVLSENVAPEWLVKTSLVDVDHSVRELLPFQNYRRDNQEFVEDYVQEVKPYHVQVREFNLKYFGIDTYLGDLTDFDLPAYWNTALTVPRFTSPILTPYAMSLPEPTNILSDAASTNGIWQQWPYSQWYSNFLLTLTDIRVVDSGTGYTGIPEIIIQGDAVIPATAVARINIAGEVIAIDVLTAGSGYRSTPVIVIQGGNGTGARAYPTMLNATTREFRVNMKFDRYQYRSDIEMWSPDGTYENGILVRYQDQVWRADNQDGSSANVGPTFDLQNWQVVPAGQLSGLDRTKGYYVPGVNMPGLDLPLLIDGLDYPGVQVKGNDFVGGWPLDAEYSSSFLDIYLGTRPTDINVDGGEFLGPYEGHAPEELVNGAIYDTLDLRVYTRPGSDWSGNGHGFDLRTVNVQWTTGSISWAGLLDAPVELLVSDATQRLQLVFGTDYDIDWDDQTITFTSTSPVQSGDIISVVVYGLGGGSQLFTGNYVGANIVNQQVVVPVNSSEINQVVVFVDGSQVTAPTFVPYTAHVAWTIQQGYQRGTVVLESNVYYRAIQTVPAGVLLSNLQYWLSFVPTLETLVTLASQPAATAGVTVVVMGDFSVQAGAFIPGRTYTIATLGTTDFTAVGAASNTVGVSFVATAPGSGSGTAYTNYSWSTPQTQIVTVDAGIAADGIITLTNSMTGTNPANLVVTRNGLRLTGASCQRWISNGTETSFGLPQRVGPSFEQITINPNTDIQVWVDNILQVQNFGPIVGDYYVTAWGGSNVPGRQVVFNNPPLAGSVVLISLNIIDTQLTAYEVYNNLIEFYEPLNIGDVIAITSWNDTSQQDITTQVFVGPVISGVTAAEPYDSTPYDQATVDSTPGSFSYTLGQPYAVNDFFLQGDVTDAGRLWVTLDGYRLYEGQDFTVVNGELVLAAGAIGQAQVLVVTSFTDSIVPEACAFRVFQDMRGVQATYRITPQSTTTVAQPVYENSDRIYVTDVSVLTEPNLQSNVLGVITIDGERITYRNRDLSNNSISGLRRGTAGTGAADHAVGADVYVMGRDNLLAEQYQDYVVGDTTLGDGSTTEFYAPSIPIPQIGDSSLFEIESLEVYVGGVRQLRLGQPGNSQYRWIFTNWEPIGIQFVVNDDPVDPQLAPPQGVEVTIAQRRGTWWYDVSTAAARELSLQETDTLQAKFLTNR
jgi:hypothetical protein